MIGRLAAAALVLLALGCGGSDPPSADSEDIDIGSCSLYQPGTDARVTFDGYGAHSACDQFIGKFSDESGFWTRQVPNGPRPYGRGVICLLTDPDGVLSLRVEDTGTAFIGTPICGAFSRGGWR